MLEAMNEFEQILAHLSGCQRAFVLPPCPAEWLPTNSPRLADPTKMSTPHYNQILLFHTIPQPPLYPFNLDMTPSPPLRILPCRSGVRLAQGAPLLLSFTVR